MTKQYIQEIIKALLLEKPSSPQAANIIIRAATKKNKVSLPKNSEIILELKKMPNAKNYNWLIQLLKIRSIRTLSGVAPVAVLVKPYPCPGKCAFCPTEKNVPKSYLPNEPAVMRAIRCHYNPIEQVRDRIKALEANGHQTDKIELIVIGGTWSYLPKKYQLWYIAGCFHAANYYKRPEAVQPLKLSAKIKDLENWLLLEQKKNEKVKHRLIGITLETRPDYINKKELELMRQLGCTRIELGVQAIDDAILKKNYRESTVADIKEATKLALNFGFKITYHYMPGLPGSNPAKDVEMYQNLFSSEKETAILKIAKGEPKKAELQKIIKQELPDNPFNPDQIKFYPTVVTKGSLLYRWWQQGKYEAYNDETLADIIIACKKNTPPWVRIIRLIRDIPSESIVAGSKLSNFRQMVQNKGAVCQCLRCREAKTAPAGNNLKLIIRKYAHAEASEYFLSYESADEKTLFAFLRLRVTGNIALVRELHVYGELTNIGKIGQVQHLGLGKKLLALAENISKLANCENINIISGVGVRGYYRKLGYRLADTYMSKHIARNT